ncbi:MAG: DUF3048 domain-containing protein [Chloroflexi bacterium]|nr:DUF3048 domain-containing protein [Chloroflexota bacterium]
MPAPSAAPAPAASVVPSASVAPLASPSPLVELPSPTATAVPLALDDNPFAVMIDNIVEARPQTGLGAADVVYEAPAEGGIPRLMPIYLKRGGSADRIGPVRSARDYFVYLANEYHAPLVHIGASPQGFAALTATGLPDLQEIVNNHVFTRDPRRAPPHNAYVSTDSVRQELQNEGVSTDASTGALAFGDYVPGTEPATHVAISYPGAPRYLVEYDYDAESQTYARSMDGKPHTDGATGERYMAHSIVIQSVDVEPIPGDTAGRVDVTLVGSGPATLIADGTQVALGWSKADNDSPTDFQRADGQPFRLPMGEVWIQLVPFDGEVRVG